MSLDVSPETSLVISRVARPLIEYAIVPVTFPPMGAGLFTVWKTKNGAELAVVSTSYLTCAVSVTTRGVPLPPENCSTAAPAVSAQANNAATAGTNRAARAPGELRFACIWFPNERAEPHAGVNVHTNRDQSGRHVAD
jgi:hypothetical protein